MEQQEDYPHITHDAYKTAVKERNEHEITKALLQTPSSNRKNTYKPSNIKLINIYQTQFLEHANNSYESFNKTGQPWCFFMVIVQIQAITNENNRYYFLVKDQTALSNIKIYYSKTTQQSTLNNFVKKSLISQVENIENLQFQCDQQQGHPYFKLWLKMTPEKKDKLELSWLIERIERLMDYNELSFHYSQIMYDAMQSSIKNGLK